MTEVLLDGVKKQVNAELYSAYLYLSMSAWCAYEGWKGMANWMRVQAKEEQFHALVLHDQLLEMGECSTFSQIEAPPKAWESPLQMFEEVLVHEKKVSSMINELATIAMEDKNHAFYEFIQMFVKEQVEEEAHAAELCQQMRFAGDNSSALLMLDKELSVRTFTPPFPGYTV